MKFLVRYIIILALGLLPSLVWCQTKDNPETRIKKLEEENAVLRDMIQQLNKRLDRLEKKTEPAKEEDKDSKKKKKEKDEEKPADKEKKSSKDGEEKDKDKKKDDEWLPSLRGEKYRLGGRVQFEYYNDENEHLLQSAKPNSPGGTFAFDEVRLYLDAELNKDIKFTGVYDLMEDNGNVVETYFDFEKLPLHSQFRFGLQPVFFRPSRYTETYPLVGRAFWKSRQLGLTIQSDYDPFTAYFAVLNGSRLDNTGIGEDGSSDIIGDDENDLDVNGNKEISTGLRFKWDADQFGKIELLGFAGTGDLDREDVLFLQSNVPGYGFSRDKTKDFAGGTAIYRLWDFDFISQYIAGRDGELDRNGWYTELSYKFDFKDFKYLKSVRPLVRYGELNTNLTPQPYVSRGSLTWDRQQWLLAMIMEIRDNLTFKAEYAFNEEDTGGPGANNNELLFQIEFAF